MAGCAVSVLDSESIFGRSAGWWWLVEKAGEEIDVHFHFTGVSWDKRNGGGGVR